VILAALAALAYVGVVVGAAANATAIAALIGSLGGLGLLMLTYVLVRADDELLPWALLMAGIGYGISLVRGGGIDESAPLIGAGVLLAGELATWSMDERYTMRVERGLAVSRALAVAGLVVGGLLVGGLVLALAAAPSGGGLGWTLVGAVSIVALLAVVVRLART
jgi:hypothetical protein